MTAQPGLRYVYAVCRPFEAALQCQLTGVAGAPPGLLRHRGLVAVVSTVPEGDFAEEQLLARLADPDWLIAAVRAHQGVIDALTTVTTPLPLRFATVCPDDSALRTMLEAREADFLRILDRLEGRVEWGVTVRGAASGEFARALHERLSRCAEDSRLRAPAGQKALDAAYLVARANCEEFVELVDRAKDGPPGARVELSGPWAAYSFTEDLTEEPEEMSEAR
ncbi:GvpL/GvpF family gas vesicle protein [Streptomyces sp. NPDC048277]|uniref:GvpL/GvpF family gas vesicle protein n=1 Tax=Streptomyces sp. NPDC048277 TaxID=3155027 RepID=UPI0033F3CD77